jgi:hypothetical protein
MYDLEKRYGRTRWFDFLDIVRLPPAALFPELTEPFFFVTHPTCLLPPTDLECDFNYHRNAERTYACALERLTGLFGAPRPTATSNTLSATWNFERMSLSILTFLRDKTSGRSPLYARHPELWDFCRISVHLNWVQPLRDLPFVSSETLPVAHELWPARRQLMPWDRGLLGQDCLDSENFCWKRASLIGWRARQLAATFAWDRCDVLQLERAVPARSTGHSRLSLTLRNPFSLQQEPVNTLLLTGKDTGSLDAVAAEVADFWELPLKIAEYYSD